MRSRSVGSPFAGALVAVALVVAASLPVALAGAAPSDQIVTHKFFPLKPGTVFTYRGNTGKRTVVKVTSKTKTIDGRLSVQVDTKDYDGDKPKAVEHFLDWYFQGSGGTVWYMRHKSETHPEESWTAGRNGARRGILLKAHPQVGQSYRMQFAPGIAEDTAHVYSVSDKSVKMKVTSPLYKETLRFYYKAGVGLVKIVDKGEVMELKSVQNP